MSFLDGIEERILKAYKEKGLRARPFGYNRGFCNACCGWLATAPR